jgi:hypothetical protein
MLSLTPILLSYLIFSHPSLGIPTFGFSSALLARHRLHCSLFRSCLSIPGYYVRLFFKRNSLVGLWRLHASVCGFHRPSGLDLFS